MTTACLALGVILEKLLKSNIKYPDPCLRLFSLCPAVAVCVATVCSYLSGAFQEHGQEKEFWRKLLILQAFYNSIYALKLIWSKKSWNFNSCPEMFKSHNRCSQICWLQLSHKIWSAIIGCVFHVILSLLWPKSVLGHLPFSPGYCWHPFQLLISTPCAPSVRSWSTFSSADQFLISEVVMLNISSLLVITPNRPICPIIPVHFVLTRLEVCLPNSGTLLSPVGFLFISTMLY